jgi:Ca2+-binding RTX toxin-like protein
LRPYDQGLFDADSALRGSDHDPVIIGLDLDDDRPLMLVGSHGNDRLNGTEADEIIIGNGGRLDVVRGGAGADTFVFVDQDSLREQLRILDFDVAEDMLALNGAEVLSTRVLGSNLLINLDGGNDSIFLHGVTDFNDVMLAQDTFAFV